MTSVEVQRLSCIPEQVLSARAPVPAAITKCYRPLLAHITPEAFAGTLLPALQRVVKRLPEVMLPVADALIGMMTLDLSPHGETLMKDLVQQFRHPKDTVR